MLSWSTFGAWTNHWQTQTHKTHHGLDLGEATTFPFIVFSMPGHRASVATPFWAKCEDEAQNPKSGKLESSGTLENSERDFRNQISLHLYALGVIEKVLKRRCPKWPCMSHLDICSPSYGQKKGWESNWLSQPHFGQVWG